MSTDRVVLKDGVTTTTDPRLNRIPLFDPRSRAYGIAEVVSGNTARSYTWRCDARLDQGKEGACVGFAWAHEASARPFAHPEIGQADARALYARAQELDPWPGAEPTYSGTAVIAGAKAAQERGLLGEYRWAFGVADLLLALGYAGPAVLGIEWRTDMYRPDTDGWIRRTGEVVGGHAILANGARLIWLPGTTTEQKRSPNWLEHLDLDRSWVRLHNSWGADWSAWVGSNGGAQCRISVRDLQALLEAAGEACIPVTRR